MNNFHSWVYAWVLVIDGIFGILSFGTYKNSFGMDFFEFVTRRKLSKMKRFQNK